MSHRHCSDHLTVEDLLVKRESGVPLSMSLLVVESVVGRVVDAQTGPCPLSRDAVVVTPDGTLRVDARQVACMVVV